MSGNPADWDLTPRPRRLLTQAMLDRGAEIAAQLIAMANAGRQRLAEIPDDDPEGAGENSTPAVLVTMDQP